MTINAGTVTWLVVAALVLGVLAVVLDRVNFPQKPFRPKRIQTGASGSSRDRTGAHIIDGDAPDDEATSPGDGPLDGPPIARHPPQE